MSLPPPAVVERSASEPSATASPGTAPPTASPTSPTPFQPARIAGDLAARPSLWRPRVRFETPDRWYTRLVEAEEHEVWLLTWLPGQGTEIHDHGNSSGAFTVVQGELTERVFRAKGTTHPPERSLAVGDARAFGPRCVHQVVNTGNRPAVSLHVYGPALATMSYYRQEPDGRLALHRTDAVQD